MAKSTEEKLKQAYIEYHFYSTEKPQKGITFKDIFSQWLEYQKDKPRLKQNTITRYQSDYRRCIEGQEFEKRLIKDIINNAFLLAKRRKLIETNPCDLLKLQDVKDHCRERTKPKKNRVFTAEEMSALIEELHNEYKTSPEYLPNYAVPNTATGKMDSPSIS